MGTWRWDRTGPRYLGSDLLLGPQYAKMLYAVLRAVEMLRFIVSSQARFCRH